MSTKNVSGADGKADATPELTPEQAGTKYKKPRKAKKRAVVMGSRTPDPIKAQIIAALLSGQYATETEIAESIGVSSSTVSRIKAAIPKEYLRDAVTKKADLIGEKVLQFLTSTLDSLEAINVVTSREEWIDRQDAAGLTVFFGVKADKVAKILEAIERANQPEGDTIPATERH